ncbi:MAG: glycosyltransferase family 4 protein [Phycisphaeraceae bacterium]
MPGSRPTLLIVSQTFVPDPAAVGQHLADVADEMARRGWRVIVYTARRGYDDPSQRYAKREKRGGVEIRRLPLSSFGKGSIAVRLLAGFAFTLQATLRALFHRRIDAMLISTSPPMAPLAAIALRSLRRVPVTFWAMDINPDQMIAMGKLGETSLPARAFDAMYRRTIRTASKVVALDRFMAERLERKASLGDKLAIVPPWSHVDASTPPVEHDENAFRRREELGEKFVVMYSGNLSPTHPLDTILEAAKAMRDDANIAFVFVGGGLGAKQVEAFLAEHELSNALLLPYQPLEMLPHSLAAADVHVVAMGDAMVGVVHPCKVYGALAVGRPVLFVGPEPCHVTDLLSQADAGKRVEHGDVERAIQAIRTLRDLPEDERRAMGERGRALMQGPLSRERSLAAVCDAIEHTA